MVMRPADANEVVEAWRVILPLQHQPVALVLTRQALPTLDRTKLRLGRGRGAGRLRSGRRARRARPRCCCSATGSEVSLCVEAYERLVAAGVKARVVSMPSWELFERQPQEYRDSVLPPAVRARVSVEQAATFGWERYVGIDGASIGMETFGASAPLKDAHAEVRLHRRSRRRRGPGPDRSRAWPG